MWKGREKKIAIFNDDVEILLYTHGDRGAFMELYSEMNAGKKNTNPLSFEYISDDL